MHFSTKLNMNGLKECSLFQLHQNQKEVFYLPKMNAL